MTSNVTVLVLEQIAAGLGIPFQRLTGTQIVVREHVFGSDFLAELQKEPWHISSEDFASASARPTREVASRKPKKEAKAPEAPAVPAGMEGIFQRLVDVQERLTKDQSRLDSKFDKLADQVQDLASAVRGKSSADASAADEATGSRRGAKGSRKGAAATKEAPAKTGKGRRGAAARSSTDESISKPSDGKRHSDPDGDLFDRAAPEAPKRRSRRSAEEGASRTTREAALKSRGHESVKKASPAKEPGRTKRPYDRKK
ncbi:hypothetical protein [Microvirga calopogonii]|uniref:hypothetical protein n=1 Tax=Microvirga calopogonii TaxID=2078013 RepID=UPI0013B43CAF|nr:hypothetical protein [Microvirga calopogonii]